MGKRSNFERIPKDLYRTFDPRAVRPLLHDLIAHLSSLAPTWLLFDADWMHIQKSRPLMPYCHAIVSVGRCRWIPDTTDDGKDNAAWYLFDQTRPRLASGPVFLGRAA